MGKLGYFMCFNAILCYKIVLGFTGALSICFEDVFRDNIEDEFLFIDEALEFEEGVSRCNDFNANIARISTQQEFDIVKVLLDSLDIVGIDVYFGLTRPGQDEDGTDPTSFTFVDGINENNTFFDTNGQNPWSNRQGTSSDTTATPNNLNGDQFCVEWVRKQNSLLELNRWNDDTCENENLILCRRSCTTNFPTSNPTKFPIFPTISPTRIPTKFPIEDPTSFPTKSPTLMPTKFPTTNPTESPIVEKTKFPTLTPTTTPTNTPVEEVTKFPTLNPTLHPNKAPTTQPSLSPTNTQIINQTFSPTALENSTVDILPIKDDPTLILLLIISAVFFIIAVLFLFFMIKLAM